MLHKIKSNFLVLIIISATGILLTGCGGTTVNSSEEAEIISSPALHSSTKSPVNIADHQSQNVNKQMAALRSATAPFHNIDKAIQANYNTPLTPCWYHGELGAMGISLW